MYIWATAMHDILASKLDFLWATSERKLFHQSGIRLSTCVSFLKFEMIEDIDSFSANKVESNCEIYMYDFTRKSCRLAKSFLMKIEQLQVSCTPPQSFSATISCIWEPVEQQSFI